MFFNKSMIAIDIGSSAVKIVEVSHGKAHKLKSMGFELLPLGSVVDGEIKEFDAVRNTIQTLLSKLHISTRGRRAAVAIGGSNVLVKRAVIDQPRKLGEEAEQVYLEAQQAFQHDMSELHFRYALLDDRIEEGKRIVMMIGAKRNCVETYCNLVGELGMKVGLIDCDVLSLTNMFDHCYPVVDSVLILANIGASITQVIILRNGSILYSREIYQGGNDYNLRLGHELDIDVDTAETMKINIGNGDASTNKNGLQIINDVNEMLVDEISRTVAFYYQNEDPALLPAKPSQIFVCGGGARTMGIDTALAAQFALPVQVINPFCRIDMQTSGIDFDYILNNGQAYGVAVGLAIRQFKDVG